MILFFNVLFQKIFNRETPTNSYITLNKQFDKLFTSIYIVLFTIIGVLFLSPNKESILFFVFLISILYGIIIKTEFYDEVRCIWRKKKVTYD